MDTLIHNILKSTDSKEYSIYLTSTDKSNFRYTLYPQYKANRKQPKPIWYQELRAHLVAEHPTNVVTGREADDEMADQQTADTIIASIDKDLDQIPGEHYDFVKEVRYSVDEGRATRFFYVQLLTGDSTDNVPGIRGIGPAKAAKILESSDGTAEDLHGRSREAYANTYDKHSEELFLLYGRLLKIGGNVWDGMPLERHGVGPRGNKVSTDQDSKLRSDPSSKLPDLSTSQQN